MIGGFSSTARLRSKASGFWLMPYTLRLTPQGFGTRLGQKHGIHGLAISVQLDFGLCLACIFGTNVTIGSLGKACGCF
jgi:hypothetical protein